MSKASRLFSINNGSDILWNFFTNTFNGKEQRRKAGIILLPAISVGAKA
jgi:hypothetical protein